MPIILKLGGSVISHSNRIIDFDYLREFRDLLRDQIILGRRFVVVVGGGQTSRSYVDHAVSQGNVTDTEDLHWIGVAVNTLNAEMVRSFLGNETTEKRVWKYDDKDRITKLRFDKPIVVAGGFDAGKSSDWAALRIAQGLGASSVFDLKNVDGVYNSDPKEDRKAKRISNLSWEEYLNLINNPTEHKPGANLPVDVIAAREAKDLGVDYYILQASDIANLERAIEGQEFIGTLIN